MLGQNAILKKDSLLEKGFKELSDGYYEWEATPEKSILYAKAYLKKAKQKKDTFKIATGYHFMAYYFFNDSDDYKSSYTYCDSIIQITKSKKFKNYPISAYLLKADLYFSKMNFKESFNTYISLKEYIDDDDDEMNFYINHQIGGIKSKLLQNKEALRVFKQSWDFVNKKGYKTKNKEVYLQTLTDLTISYVKNRKLDTAAMYCKIGINKALKDNNLKNLNQLTLFNGINLYYQNKYLKAQEDLEKSISYFRKEKEYESLSFCYYYLGKVRLKNNENHKAINYFKQVDTIFQKTININPEVRDTYERLVNYYKSKKDDKNTLLYIEQLLRVDSVLNSNYKYLSPKIITEYDTPKLLSEKEKVISNLYKKKNNVSSIAITLGSIAIVFSFLWLYNYKKRVVYKRRFENLVLRENKKTRLGKEKVELVEPKKSDIGIAGEVVSKILNQIDNFEKEEGYLKNGITINALAKKLQTNPKYLSAIINHYKEKSFSSYINELRIKYAIERLKTDPVFRKYTIKAIAYEVGFNTPESFSTAFYKEAQLKPSYFLKNLKN